MSSTSPESVEDQLAEPDRILSAARQAVRESLDMHKRLGLSVVEDRDGEPVWVEPENIVVDGDDAADVNR